MFLGRKKELTLLEENYLKPTSDLLFLFGRKKVGKTALINEYTTDKLTIYLSCIEMIPKLFFNNLHKNLLSFFDLKSTAYADNLDEILIFINEQKILKKLIIVIDDFQNLLKIDKNALYTLSSYWNKHLHKKNIQLILSSSIYSSIPKDVKIYEKASAVILMKPLDIGVIKELIPEVSKTDVMYIYASFGTNLNYLKNYDTKKDFILNVKDTFLSSQSSIFEEGLNIIRQDLSDVLTYASILHAIAMGNNKIGDIANFLGLKSTYLTRYIQKLVDMMIISKTIPINDDKVKSKFGRYFIEDNYLKFWFCYVYPNISSLRKNDLYGVVSHIRRDFSKRLVTDAYKKYVLDLITSEPEKFFGYTPIKIGSWWNNKDHEIDIIAFDNKEITFIDCRWRKKDSIESSYQVLKDKSNYLNTPLSKKYIIFAKNYTS
ncbi:MAG: ATP-binding protein [Campylobacteraceae bacterium]|nr:ATP-binding protein [Campylobacteraceae bacterium]